MNGQSVYSRTDTGVHSRTDSTVHSGHDTSVHQTQYQHKSNTNSKFGRQRVQSEKKVLTYKQEEFIKALVERVQKKSHDPRFSYLNYDKLKEEMKEGMLKKDGSFEKLMDMYELN